MLEESKKTYTTNQLIDIKNHETLEGYSYFAYAIGKSESLSKETKNKLAMKIYETGDTVFVFEWLNKVDCDYNYTMIEGLLLKESIIIFNMLVYLDSTELLTYALDHLLLCEMPKIKEVLHMLWQGSDNLPIFKIEMVLDKLFAKYPGYKLEKDEVISLICAGTKYTELFLKSYELNAEDRGTILGVYIENNETELLVVYGSYLMTGDKSKLVNGEALDIDIEVLKLMREKNTSNPE